MLIDELSALLTEAQWQFVVRRDARQIQMKIVYSNAEHWLAIQVCENPRAFFATLTYPRKCPPRQRESLIELIHEINFVHTMGGLEMDPASGECRVRNSVDLQDLALTPEFVDGLLGRLVRFGCKHWPEVEERMSA
jgi:hypothetical protein